MYSAQALRHVAEQIDALYWAAGAPDPGTGDADEGAVGRGAELRDHEYGDIGFENYEAAALNHAMQDDRHPSRRMDRPRQPGRKRPRAVR